MLPGGARVITEQVEGVRSAAFGAWVQVGSRDETGHQLGASHFLEHLLFKGTPSRSALEISSAVESVGGQMNAFTAKEVTCYHAHMLDADLPLAIDIITDMITSALIRTEDVDSERGVVLEEMAMRDDDPADLALEGFSTAVLGDSVVGRPIIGTRESITTMSRRTVHGYFRRKYQPEFLVFAAAGNVDHAAVVRRVRKALAAAGWLDGSATPAPPRRITAKRLAPTDAGVELVTRDSEQAHLTIGVPGLVVGDERRFTMRVLGAVLGGGMSSRLFQEVREKRGLAYSVYSFQETYADAGMFGIYAGCPPQRFEDVIAVCRDELKNIASEPVPADELASTKGQLRGGSVLGLESTNSRMSRIGRAEVFDGTVLPTDQILAAIDAVTAEQVQELASELFAQPMSISAVGPFSSKKQLRRAVA